VAERIIEVVFDRFDASDRRWLALAGALLYALFLIVAPFEHHDLLCHLKNPQHCTSCSSSALGNNAPAPTPFVARLADAGSVLQPQLTAAGVLLSVRTTGRSPPLARQS
jgi:hypothetical protein